MLPEYGIIRRTFWLLADCFVRSKENMNAYKGCFIGCLGMIVATGVMLVGVAALVWLGVAAADMKLDDGGGKWSERDKPRDKVWVSGNGNEDAPQVLRVKISGVISESRSDVFGREKSSATAALEKIRSAIYDDDIQGLYLVLDTPGGEVTLSDVIADAVRRFRKSSDDRFVLAEMGAVCCSGGYYIASAADYIIAHPTTITGSIGVLMSTINASELAKKVGVESVVIATGANKAMLDPLKPVDQAHIGIFKKAIDADYERFLSVVAKGRKLSVDAIRPIADGRILCAEEAKRLKLVDAIGYAEEAEEQLAELAKSEDVRIVRYKDQPTWRDMFEGSFLSSQGMARALRSAAAREGSVNLNFMAE